MSILALPVFAASKFEMDLNQMVEDLNHLEDFNAESCGDFLGARTRYLLMHGADAYVRGQAPESGDVFQQAPDLVKKLFDLRLRLIERLNEFHQRRTLTPQCLKQVRRAIRYGRYLEEYIGDQYEKLSDMKGGDQPLSGQAPALMVNGPVDGLTFQSGDVLLLRNASSVSATISRIGDEDGQFSHAVMLYVPEGSDPLVIEARIGYGVIISPLQELFSHHPARVLLLRHRNPEWAAEAARKTYLQVTELDRKGEYIPYDYLMDGEDKSALFCTELVETAYRLGSGGRTAIPSYPSSLNMLVGNPFLENLGINARVAFTPSDLEVEPEMQLVAEWRDFAQIGEVRRQDAIITTVLDWLTNKGYQLTLKGPDQWAANAAWGAIRFYSGINRRVSANMSRQFVKSMFAVKWLARILDKELDQYEQQYRGRYGVPMDFQSTLDALEQIRREDCQRFIDYAEATKTAILESAPDPERPHFHQIINTAEPLTCNAGILAE